MLILLCVALLFPACRNEEWIKFQPIDFDVEGTTLAQNRNDHSFTASVKAEGGAILFVANGKNASSGHLSQFCAEATCISVFDTDLSGAFPRSILILDWGSVDIMDNAPHTTKISLHPNGHSAARHFRFTFGGGYTVAHIELTQAGMVDGSETTSAIEKTDSGTAP